MKKTRTKKAALNLATATLLEIVSFVCGMILPRFIMVNFGSSYNGIISSTKDFLSVISILNLGVAGSTRVALYKTLAAGDKEGTSRIVRATERHMRKVGCILIIYIGVLALVYPFVVKTGFGFWDVALIIIATGINAFAQYFFGSAYQAFLSADQSVYISNIFTILSMILNTVVSVILIKAGCSIQVVKFGSAAVFVLKPFLQNVYVTKKYELDKHCEPDMSALKSRGDVMAHSVANIVHAHTDAVVLTLFCGVKVVSVYSVYNLIMSGLRKMQNVFTTGTESLFGNMWAKGEYEKVKKNLGIYEFFVVSFSSIAFSLTLVLILPFIALYTKNVTDIEYIIPTYAVVVTLAEIFQCVRAPYLTLVQGVGHYKQTRNGAIVEAVINVVLSVVLVQFYGIVGVAIGTLAANLFRTFQYALYIDKNLVRRGKTVFLRKILWMGANIAVIFAASYQLVNRYAVLGWMNWVLCALADGVFAIAVVLLSSSIFYRKDLRSTVRIVKRLFRKKTVRLSKQNEG